MEITERIIDWLGKLVQIPSVSPDQAGPRSGPGGEANISAAIATWFQAVGGEVHQHEVLPNRSNIYGVWRGRTDRWAAVDVHVDTVSVEQMTGDPFSGHLQDGRVYGRGAVDTKASLGVVLALLEAMHQNGQTPEQNLLIAATVDEEVGATGAPAFAEWLRQHEMKIDQLMVAEPTECIPIYGHKGVVRLEFHIEGYSVHSSQPEKGSNAVMAGAYLMMAFDEEHQRLQETPPKTDLGHPKLTVTIAQGGTGINVVPDACQISIDRRVVADEKADDVVEWLQRLADAACPLAVTSNVQKALDAFWQDPNAPWVCQLSQWSGQTPIVAPYGTNAWAYGDVAKDCIVFGPGSIDQAHGVEEWVAVSELEKVAQIYARWWGIDSDQ